MTDAFKDMHYDIDGKPTFTGRKPSGVTIPKDVRVTDLSALKPATTLTHRKTSTYRGKVTKGIRYDLTTVKIKGIDHVIIEEATLAYSTCQTIYRALGPLGTLYHRPKDARLWKSQPQPKAVPEKPKVQKGQKMIRTNVYDKDGLPVYFAASEEAIREEMEGIWAAYAPSPETPSDAVTVYGPRLLAVLPSESAKLLHVQSYYLTSDHLHDVLRILKPDTGVLVFKPLLLEEEKTDKDISP